MLKGGDIHQSSPIHCECHHILWYPLSFSLRFLPFKQRASLVLLHQLQGCRIFAVTGAGDEVGDTVLLDPGSEAEEAVLVTAAASAVVVFLREIERHAGVSQKVG